jgi:hypothetical protein
MDYSKFRDMIKEKSAYNIEHPCRYAERKCMTSDHYGA